MKVCPDCFCEELMECGESYVCPDCGNEHKESELYFVPDEIPEETLKRGLDKGVVQITYNKGCTFGIACKIGDYLFYFDGIEADIAESVEDYFDRFCSWNELPERLYDVIGTPQRAKNNGIPVYEWMYYAFTLEKALKEISA